MTDERNDVNLSRVAFERECAMRKGRAMAVNTGDK